MEGLVKGGLIIVDEQTKVGRTVVGGTVRISGAMNGRVRARSIHLDTVR